MARRPNKAQIEFFKRRKADQQAGIVRYTPQDFADILSTEGFRGRTSVTLRGDENIAKDRSPSLVSDRSQTSSTDAGDWFSRNLRR
jgi:hypothetical protein